MEAEVETFSKLKGGFFFPCRGFFIFCDFTSHFFDFL